MDLNLDSNADEDFFGALNRKATNLEQLFEYEIPVGDKEESLKYRPTQETPKTNHVNATINAVSSCGTTLQAWQTLLAKVVQAHSNGAPVGKVGAALLQSNENDYRIIIYKDKLNVLANCSLHPGTAQIHRQNSYLQFYDDAMCCWSLYFGEDASTEAFVAKLKELNIEVNVEEKCETNDAETSGNNSSDIENPLITTVKPTKIALMTRMAKMGQQLPKLPLTQHSQISVDTTDYSDMEAILTPEITASEISSSNSKAITQPLHITKLNYVPDTVCQVHGLESQFMHMMLSENRTHNSELRMNMNKLESKVERVLDTIDLLNVGAGVKLQKEDELLALEEKVLMLKKENRHLKQTLEKKESSSIESCEQILKIYRSQLEEINLANVNNLEGLVGDLLKQRAAMHDRLEQLERDLIDKNVQLQTGQIRLNDEQSNLAESMTKIELLEAEVKTLREQLSDMQKTESVLREQLTELERELFVEKQLLEQSVQNETQMSTMVSDLQEKNKVLQKNWDEQQMLDKTVNEQQDFDEESESLTVEQQIETVLKKAMNNLYANLAVKFDNAGPLKNNVIIAIIGKTIRDITLKTMDELKK